MHVGINKVLVVVNRYLGRLFCVLLFSAGVIAAFGQGFSDTLITRSGDVLIGRYSKPVFGHSGFIVDGKKQALDAKKYKAYTTDGVWFRSVKLSSGVDPVWMRWLERGAIDLFQYIAYGAATRISPRNLPASYVVWLASKNGGPLLNVNGVMASEGQARDNLFKLLSDQPKLAGELDSLPFTTNTVAGLIAAYNRRADSTRSDDGILH